MVKLPRSIEQKIRFIGEKVYPEEGCGIIFGGKHEADYHVREIIEVLNSAPVHRDERYSITPQQFQEAEKIMKDHNIALIGLFHSHPNHRPEPSVYDLEHALPFMLYIIVAVVGGVATGMTAWTLTENRQRFDQATIEIEN